MAPQHGAAAVQSPENKGKPVRIDDVAGFEKETKE